MDIKEQMKTRAVELEKQLEELTKEYKAIKKYLEAIGESIKPKRIRKKKGEK